MGQQTFLNRYDTIELDSRSTAKLNAEWFDGAGGRLGG